MEMVVVVGITDSSRSPVRDVIYYLLTRLQAHYISMRSNIIPDIYCKKESENNEE
jgi:hypothetical protein